MQYIYRWVGCGGSNAQHNITQQTQQTMHNTTTTIYVHHTHCLVTTHDAPLNLPTLSTPLFPSQY